MNAQGWHRLVAEIEQLDITAGRALREALAVHDAPLLIRVSGRAGTGREGVESAVRTLVRDVRVVGAVTDAPGELRSEPADIVVHVVPRRLDPGEAHPADLAAVAPVDPGRLILVVTGATADEVATVAAAHGIDPDRAVQAGSDTALGSRLEGRAVDAIRLRRIGLAHAAARIAAGPEVRDRIERALDEAATAVPVR